MGDGQAQATHRNVKPPATKRAKLYAHLYTPLPRPVAPRYPDARPG